MGKIENSIVMSIVYKIKRFARAEYEGLNEAQQAALREERNKLAQELASSGFRDTTRLALSNLEMASDMVELNQENIIKAYETFKDCFKNIVEINYKQKAENIKNFRKNLYN